MSNMKRTKTGLTYFVKGSPQAKQHMAKLRKLRSSKGSKNNPMIPDFCAICKTQVKGKGARRGVSFRSKKVKGKWQAICARCEPSGTLRLGGRSMQIPMESDRDDRHSADNPYLLGRVDGGPADVMRRYPEGKPSRRGRSRVFNKGLKDLQQRHPDATEYEVGLRKGRTWDSEHANNPPAYFVIDPKTNRILQVSRAGRAGMDSAYKKAVAYATAQANQLDRDVIVVVHPYIPQGFKRGTEVSSLFHHYGAVTVEPSGRVVRSNPGILGNLMEGIAGGAAFGIGAGIVSRYIMGTAPPAPRETGRRMTRRNPAGSAVMSTPSQLEASKIAGWMGQEGVDAWVDAMKGQWTVMVPKAKAAAGRAALGRVLKNPRNNVCCSNPGQCSHNPLTDYEKYLLEIRASNYDRVARQADSHGSRRYFEGQATQARDIAKWGGARPNPLIQTFLLNPPQGGYLIAIDSPEYDGVVWMERNGDWVGDRDHAARFKTIQSAERAAKQKLPSALNKGDSAFIEDERGFFIKNLFGSNPCKTNPLTVAESREVAQDAMNDAHRARKFRGERRGFYTGRASMGEDVVRRYGPGFVRKNPKETIDIPFKEGQKISVAEARAWVESTGDPELLRQFNEAERLQKKANRPAKHLIWRTIPIGSKRELDMVTAVAHYGDSPETMYRPPKGSKKGRHMYRHEWGEGSGKEKPVPILAAPGGGAMIVPVGDGQTVGDWMRG